MPLGWSCPSNRFFFIIIPDWLTLWVGCHWQADGDQGQGQIEANQQGQEEEEDQEVDVQEVIHPSQRLTRSMFKALGNNGQLFSLFVISLVDGASEGNIRNLLCKSILSCSLEILEA